MVEVGFLQQIHMQIHQIGHNNGVGSCLHPEMWLRGGLAVLGVGAVGSAHSLSSLILCSSLN